MEKAVFKTIYEDFFSVNAPYRIAVGDFTREALKICIELADPIRIKHASTAINTKGIARKCEPRE